MLYTIELAERIAKALRQLPAVEDKDRSLNKREMVQRLADEIVDLQTNRGYSLEQIADKLKRVGFEIATATLRTYLQQNRPKRRRGSSGRKRGEQPVEATSRSVSATSRVRATARPSTVLAAKLDAAEKRREAGAAATKAPTRGDFLGQDRKRL
jgi:hypothetical protein